MRKTLIAKKGYVLTDGVAFVKIVDLAEGDNGENWHEITESEHEKILKEQREAAK